MNAGECEDTRIVECIEGWTTGRGLTGCGIKLDSRAEERARDGGETAYTGPGSTLTAVDFVTSHQRVKGNGRMPAAKW